MNEFLNVIRDINWDMLHRQKEELIDIVTSDSMDVFKKQDSELDGLVNLIDALQDVAEKLRIWRFPDDPTEDEPERDHTDDICPCGDVDCSRPWGHE